MAAQTICLHRILKAQPEKIYKAFTNPLAIVKWLPPHGFVGEVLQWDLRVNGTFKMAFVNVNNGAKNSFGGKFLELVPHSLIRHTDSFDDPNMPGELTTTIHLKVVHCGTELHVEQKDIPEFIPAEMCYLGWQESLFLLAQLVEANIPE